MTIEYIDLKPQTTTVKLGDYGEFTIRKFGAGEELELQRIAREITEMSDSMKALGSVKEIEESGDEKKIAETRGIIAENMQKIHELQARQLKLLQAVVSGEPEAVERLFNENGVVELFSAIGKVARG